jgi:hypothetical protein
LLEASLSTKVTLSDAPVVSRVSLTLPPKESLEHIYGPVYEVSTRLFPAVSESLRSARDSHLGGVLVTSANIAFMLLSAVAQRSKSNCN